MNPKYFLEEIKQLLGAPGAFPGYEVAVFEGTLNDVLQEYSLQVYPVSLKERTRAEGVVSCTDTWQIAGTVNTDGLDATQKLLDFIADTKSAIDKLEITDGAFTYGVMPEVKISYEAGPRVVFNLQLDVNYDRRIK